MSPGPFDTASLAKVVHDSLAAAEAAIPNGHNQAILLDATYTRADGPGVRALYVQRAGDRWTVLGEVAYRRDDGPRVGVAVRWSGK